MRSSSRWSLPVYCLACRRAPVSGHARSRFPSARALLAALLLSASSSAWSDEAQVARPKASYGIDVMPGLLVQPVLEYFINPGAAEDTPDAFVIGLKTIAKF